MGQFYERRQKQAQDLKVLCNQWQPTAAHTGGNILDMVWEFLSVADTKLPGGKEDNIYGS